MKSMIFLEKREGSMWRESLFGMEWRMENDPKQKYSNVVARLLLPPDVQNKRDLIVKISQIRLLIQFATSKVSGPETIVDAEFARKVTAEESTWTIEDEDKKRFLVLQLAKKVDGENWPSLFLQEKGAVVEEAKNEALKPKLSDAQTEKQLKARAASDLVVLNGLMAKLAPEAKSELERLLAQGG